MEDLVATKQQLHRNTMSSSSTAGGEQTHPVGADHTSNLMPRWRLMYGWRGEGEGPAQAASPLINAHAHTRITRTETTKISQFHTNKHPFRAETWQLLYSH